MGKLLTFLSILIFIDIIFLITGQVVINSPLSIISDSILDPTSLLNHNLWTVLVTGLGLLTVGTAVAAGFITRQSDIIIFFVMAGTLALLIGDYIQIYSYVAQFNQVLATIILVPILMIFTLVIIEWARGKD